MISKQKAIRRLHTARVAPDHHRAMVVSVTALVASIGTSASCRDRESRWRVQLMGLTGFPVLESIVKTWDGVVGMRLLGGDSSGSQR
jgi:hypothetical protein